MSRWDEPSGTGTPWVAPGLAEAERDLNEMLGPIDGYDVVGWPGSGLNDRLRPGDLLLRARGGFRVRAQVAHVAGPELHDADALSSGDAEGAGDGWYAEAVWRSPAGQGRIPAYVRVVDSRGRVPQNQIVIRSRPILPAVAPVSLPPPQGLDDAPGAEEPPWSGLGIPDAGALDGGLEETSPTPTPRSWELPATEWVNVNYYLEWIKGDTLEYLTQPTRKTTDRGLDKEAFPGLLPLTLIDLLALLEIERPDPASPADFQMGLKTKAFYPGTAASPTDVAPGGPYPVVLILPGNHGVQEVRQSPVTPPATAGRGPWKKIPGTADGWVREILSHAGYEYLQEDLARSGVVSFAISTNPANALDAMVQTRADLVMAYLDLLRRIQSGGIASPLAGHLDLGRVGLLGHSRGGDGVVKGALDNAGRNASSAPPATPIQIKAVCALAPTDSKGTARPSDRPVMASPVERFLVVYGSHDGDVSGVGGGLERTGTGFRHYDRSMTRWDTMIFVRGVAHNRFNTTWDNSHSPGPAFQHGDPSHRLVDQSPYPSDPTCGVTTPPGPPACPSPTEYRSIDAHKALAREYIGGFFRWALGGEALEARFKGEVFPLAAGAGISAADVAIQYMVPTHCLIDGFQRDPPGRNALAGPASYTSSQTVEFELGNRPDGNSTIPLAPRVPHQTRILDARPGSAAQVVYRTEIPAGPLRNTRPYSHICFRMTAGFDVSAPGTILSRFPPWKLRIFTGEGSSPAASEAGPAALDTRGVRAPKPPFFHELWVPREGVAKSSLSGEVVNVTKLHFQTVAIPLVAFRGADLEHLQAVELELGAGTMPFYFDTLCLMAL